MKRTAYLRDLSSDHHHALRLTRDIRNYGNDEQGRQELVRMVCKEYREKLLPHFIVEEYTIVPVLYVLGEWQLADQVLEEHHLLNGLVEKLEESQVLERFAEALQAHVRFEERSVFEVCQGAIDTVKSTKSLGETS
jgi:hypothetical protein